MKNILIFSLLFSFSTAYAQVNEQEHKFAMRFVNAYKQGRIAPVKKNRVYMLFGHGPSGSLKFKRNEVKTKSEIVGGIGYQRKIDNDYAVGAQFTTNGSGFITFGLDF